MKDITDLLPVYPQACSVLVLAIGAKILREPYTDRRAARAVRKVMRSLDKATLDGVPVLERRLPVTESTKKALEAKGFSGPFSGTAAYFSIRK